MSKIDYTEVARATHAGFDAMTPDCRAGVLTQVARVDYLLKVDGRSAADLAPAEQAYAEAILKAEAPEVPAKATKPKGK